MHETDTVYAQGFREDAYSKLMGKIELKNIIFSKDIQNQWSDNNLWNRLLNKKEIINPKRV